MQPHPQKGCLVPRAGPPHEGLEDRELQAPSASPSCETLALLSEIGWQVAATGTLCQAGRQIRANSKPDSSGPLADCSQDLQGWKVPSGWHRLAVQHA